MIEIIGGQLTQWDVSRVVKVTDSKATHVHLANRGDTKAVIMRLENGEAKIPDYLLQTGKVLFVYGVLDGMTIETKSFPVQNREKPEGYVYEEDTRNYIYSVIVEAEKATDAANKAADAARQAVQETLDIEVTNESVTKALGYTPANQSDVSKLSKDLDVERARINALTKLPEGSTTGDAELADARVDKDGKDHPNVGEHIRSVDRNLSEQIDDVKNDLIGTNKEVSLFPDNGYITLDGSIIPDSNEYWYHSKQTEIKDKAIEISFNLFQLSSDVLMLAFYDKDYLFISGVSNAGTDKTIVSGTTTIPENAKYVRATYRVEKGVQYFKIKYDYGFEDIIELEENVHALEKRVTDIEELSEKYFLTTSVAKPMNFTDGNVICFGDSTMRGYLPNSTETTDNNWINLFKTDAQINNVKNCALGGATYAISPHSGVKTVYQQMTTGNNGGAEILNTRTHIIILCGTNDYDKGVPKADFIGALSQMAEYVKANKGENTKVILITPLGRTKETTYEKQASLNWYRQAITECALSNNFSVINGKELGIPSVESEYHASVSSDGLHLTELGNRVVANTLDGILL